MISPTRMLLLREVARGGSLTRAADILGYTTSALSQHMKLLEQEAGVPLMERHSRGVSLTPAGKAVAEQAEKISTHLTHLEHSLAELRTGHSGDVRCGFFPTLACAIGADVLKKLSSQHPQLKLQVRGARLPRLYELLEQRNIDVALTWDYTWSEQVDSRFVKVPIMRDSSVLLVPDSDGGKHWRDIVHEDTAWITRADGHMASEVLSKVAAEQDFVPQISYQANQWAEVQAMVATRIGAAIAPALATVPLRPGVTIVPFPSAPARTIYVTRRRGHVELPGEELVVDEITRVRAQLSELPE